MWVIYGARPGKVGGEVGSLSPNCPTGDELSAPFFLFYLSIFVSSISNLHVTV